ncbi:MAG: cob(I)yrinic acid a,c-diamide adenosyltransferase [Ruminococcus sp.]|nr:cob(I)yrinic acid a,c-diamide adenosyltransferase [Ruminococcus sp.]
MIHYYYGDGKGKTSAAAGACLRAAGNGMKCAFVQFLKNAGSGEAKLLGKCAADVYNCGGKADFLYLMSDEDKAELRAVHDSNLRKVLAGSYDLIVLDELGDCIEYGMIDMGTVSGMLTAPPCELVITGHTPVECLMKCADYITEMKCIEHPYRHGASARRGIEY